MGYIIRDEKVVKGNNYKNGMEQIKTEGEKTAKGESIYRYYSKKRKWLNKTNSWARHQNPRSLRRTNKPLYIRYKINRKSIRRKKIEQLNGTTDISKLTEYKKEINKLITKEKQI